MRQLFPGAHRKSCSKRVKRKLTLHKTFTDEELSCEEWKVFPHDERYQVSSLGRVKGPGGLLRTPLCKKRNYEHISIGGKQYLVHQVVLIAFVGPCPDGLVACHFDDDPTNNRLCNLRWDTMEANIRDKIRNGNARGRKPKLTEEQRLKIAMLRHQGYSLKELSAEFGVNEGTISKISRKLLH